jgi:hypothetical protein
MPRAAKAGTGDAEQSEGLARADADTPRRAEESLTETAEARALAREMAAAYRHMLEGYCRYHGIKPEEALVAVQESRAARVGTAVRTDEPDQVSWYDLNLLAEANPEQATQQWNEIKQAARADLDGGHRAARAVREAFGSTPWDKAQFLAVRAALTEQWQPQGGVEQLLIDTLAQAYTEQHRWMAAANNFLSAECDRHRLEIEKKEKWLPPRITEAEALDRAMAMSERWNRMFLRTLRALRDLRRYASTITIQNAGQVNIGSQQLNVSAPTRQRDH